VIVALAAASRTLNAQHVDLAFDVDEYGITGASWMQLRETSDYMSAEINPLTFAAIGDLHVKEERTSLLRELFAEVSTQAKVLVLCGDLTDVGKPREAEVLAEDLRACSIPVVGVLGNHRSSLCALRRSRAGSCLVTLDEGTRSPASRAAALALQPATPPYRRAA
jgi:predicted MPP superfamily phosphohydrolase